RRVASRLLLHQWRDGFDTPPPLPTRPSNERDPARTCRGARRRDERRRRRLRRHQATAASSRLRPGQRRTGPVEGGEPEDAARPRRSGRSREGLHPRRCGGRRPHGPAVAARVGAGPNRARAVAGGDEEDSAGAPTPPEGQAGAQPVFAEREPFVKNSLLRLFAIALVLSTTLGGATRAQAQTSPRVLILYDAPPSTEFEKLGFGSAIMLKNLIAHFDTDAELMPVHEY